MPIIADVTGSAGPTLDQLVDEITSAAQGFAIAPDKMATLGADITGSALTLTIQGDVTPGVFEIGDELILITAVDPLTGACVVHPRGRGWQGTEAVAHSAGDVIVEGPALPRARVVSMVNDQITSFHPLLFGVGEVVDELTSKTLELPAEAEFVLEVRRETSESDWARVRHWEAEMSSELGTTGKVVRVPAVETGTQVQVVYAHRPEPLSSNDQFWSDTGLALGVKDVVVLGVLARFAQALDLGRLTDRYVSPRGDTQQPQLGAGFGMARQLKADYQTALDREVQALRTLYPARAHFTR